MDPLLQKRINEWTSLPFDELTRKEILELNDRNEEKELTDRFYKILEFGTGGLRGILGAGTNRMNVYTVGMATQGLANYIISKCKQNDGVVIARDSRRMSEVFAKEAACILAANNIQVYLFDDIMPTPLCSFAIRELQAGSGIVITASHNPPEYNGYKAYWDDGAQIVPPYDREIIGEVKKIESISQIKKMDYQAALQSGTIKIIGDDIINAYIKNLEKYVLREKMASSLKIAYTPLHGTGYHIVPQVLKHFGFKDIYLVENQSKPDGEFPTVSYPNPEERNALEQVIKTAEKTGADIFMATDPDADRMGVGFKDGNGGYRIINGNQIGTMLEYYMLTRIELENKMPANGAVLKTIVTTDLQDRIAESFNCHVDNVLTGFKWIGLKMKEYESSGNYSFIFGGEESYGYLPVPFVRDKDAVSSCYFFAEMADWLSRQGRNLSEFLNSIYMRYGFYMESLHSITLKGKDGMEQMTRIMKYFRENPPLAFAGSKVIKIADIEQSTITDTETGKAEVIKDLPKSNVLQYYLFDGSKITMRPSGTEPKIKFYFSVHAPVSSGNIEKVEANLTKRLDDLKVDLNSMVEDL